MMERIYFLKKVVWKYYGGMENRGKGGIENDGEFYFLKKEV
jgi:hypothetical protein